MSKRSRGMGSLILRGKTWWIQYRHNGKLHRESTGTESRSEALSLLRRRLRDLQVGQPAAVSLERTTFEELAAAIRDDYRVNGRKSEERLETSLKALSGVFTGAKLVTLTYDRLNAYISTRLGQGMAPASIQKELSALRRGYHLLERAGKAKCPPFPTLTIRNARKGFFEDHEIEAVIALLPEDLQPLVRFLSLTGWRRGEALGLRWGQVDFTSGIVRLEVGETKNDDGRVFPFSALPALRDILIAQRERKERLERLHGKIIPTVFFWSDEPAGRPILDFRGSWEKACEDAALPGRLVHDLRRSAVRRLERSGVPRSIAMRLSGHRTESVYRRYAIVSERDLAEGVAKLAIGLQKAGG